MRLRRDSLLLLVATLAAAPHFATAEDALTIRITCVNDDGQTSAGSGVLVGPEGQVLTAKHVVPEGYICKGAIGGVSAETHELEPIAVSLKYDGMLLKFAPTAGTNFDHATYCELHTGMKGRDIRVFGFHADSIAEPSVTDGIISTHRVGSRGMFETTAETVHGKSGGPAFLKGTRSIVGIVGEVRFAASGLPIGYFLTPADKLAGIAGLKASTNCDAASNGYTVALHEAILNQRLAQLRADLERASIAEKEVLQLKLDVVLRDKATLEASHLARQKELRALRAQLAELQNGGVSAKQLQAALAALSRGETALADQIFKDVEAAEAAGVRRFAAAAYGRGLVAVDAVRWHDAARHFAKAAQHFPNFDHLVAARRFAWKTGDYKAAFRYGERLLEMARRDFEPVSQEVSIALNEQGLSLNEFGYYEEAEELLREALRIDAETIGVDHPDYARGLGNLGGILKSMGRYGEAEKLFRDALAIHAKIGADHPDRATSMSNLAALLVANRQFETAEPLYREAIEIERRTLGTDHPSFAVSLSNLGSLLSQTNRREEAEPLYREAVDIFRTSFGSTHPDYAIGLGNLGLLLVELERYDEAEPLYMEAMAITEANKGLDHPDYAVDLSNLAGLFRATGRLERAEEYYRRAIGINEAALGRVHPDVAIGLNNLAFLLKSLDRFNEAELLFREAHQIFVQVLGAENENTRLFSENLDKFLAEKAVRAE